MKNNRHTYYLCAFFLEVATLIGGASPAFAALSAPSLGTASTFAVLSAAPAKGGAVTCTDSTITGDVGSTGTKASVVQTSCTITGAVVAPVSRHVSTDFNGAYDALAGQPCGQILDGVALPATLAGVTLTPGVYCFPAAATLTGTLTLAGSSTDTWIFKVGTGGGALTGDSFSVVMDGGAVACNVYWWVHDAATMTDSNFKGTILAGAGITLTRGTFAGRALAKEGVTLTGVTATGCGSGAANPPKQHCNQGVGNGPEGCDPGNSNQGFPFRSNDEIRGTSGNPGTPGNPGRKGGNK